MVLTAQSHKSRILITAVAAVAVMSLMGSTAGTASAGSGLPPVSERVFFITGATDGIGRFTAGQLAKQGATVLVHGRNPTRIETTVKELQRLGPSAKIHAFQADLSEMSQVRSLAAEVSKQFPVIHGLLNNAGTFDGDYTGKRKESSEGNEYSLAVNVMAPFLLTSLLLENVRASGAGRVIVTSSISMGSSDALKDLQLRSGWNGHRAYSLSKLCDAMMAMEMHARYGDAPRLCFFTMDPGTVDTKMLRAGWWSGGEPVSSATISHRLLTEDSYQRESGRCFCGQDREVGDVALRGKLWDDLVQLTGAQWP